MIRDHDPSAMREPLSSPEYRWRVKRATFLRPISLITGRVGTVSFVATLVWWIVPLTLATYAALVFLDIRSPLFQSRVLVQPRRRPETHPEPLGDRNIFLKRRALAD